MSNKVDKPEGIACSATICLAGKSVPRDRLDPDPLVSKMIVACLGMFCSREATYGQAMRTLKQVEGLLNDIAICQGVE